MTSLAKPLRSTILGLLAFSAAINLLLLAGPIYMLQIYDRVLVTRHIGTLVALSALLMFAFVCLAALDCIRLLLLSRVASAFEKRVSPVVLARSIDLAARAPEMRNAQPLRDVATVRSFIAGSLAGLFDLPFVPIFYAVLYLLHPLLGLVVTIGGVVAFVLAYLNDHLTRLQAKHVNAAALQALNEADAIVRNSDAVRAMGMLPRLLARRQARWSSVESEQRLSTDTGSMLAAGSRLLRYVLQSGVLGLAAYLVIDDQLTAGKIIAATVLSSRALAPIDQLTATWRSLQAMRFAWQRLSELLAKPAIAVFNTRMPEPHGVVEIDRLMFQPQGAREPVIRGVTAVFMPGQVNAIVGPSGAGKTTLLRLIAGSLQPSAGSVRLDGADISKLNLEDRLANVGYLPQTVELLPGTVRENIARFQEAPDSIVVAAAKLAGAHEAILTLPEGYETRIGEAGFSLSGGQRQRIGLARALFGEPRLVALDEPNSSLDRAGDQALAEALGKLKADGCTVFVVIQRMTASYPIDNILVLKGGTVAEFTSARDSMQKLEAEVPALSNPALAPAAGARR